MSVSVNQYRTPSGRVSYRQAYIDSQTELLFRRGEIRALQKERDEVPKPVRVICRIVGRLLRGRDAGRAVHNDSACTSHGQGNSVGKRT